MFPRITAIRVLDGHSLWLEYDDGVSGEIDFSATLERGGVFLQLRDPVTFAKVSIGEGGRFIAWPGEVDFCADALREKLEHPAESSAA